MNKDRSHLPSDVVRFIGNLYVGIALYQSQLNTVKNDGDDEGDGR